MSSLEELNKKSIYELRVLGRALGVKSVTTLKKDALIQTMIDIEKGIVEPMYSKRGRPALSVELYKPAPKTILTRKQRTLINQAFNRFKKEVFTIIDDN